ncbi:MAG: hypothetical protein ACFFAN_07730 [Promethearchaeota archaeon]
MKKDDKKKKLIIQPKSGGPPIEKGYAGKIIPARPEDVKKSINPPKIDLKKSMEKEGPEG